MAFAEPYFSKQKNFFPSVADRPLQALQFAVVIPAYRETNLETVLDSLWQAHRPAGFIEVLIVVNAPGNAEQEVLRMNEFSASQVEAWALKHPDERFRVFCIRALFPLRQAGVGLARKVGMDEATWRFNSIDNPTGFIVSLDADCTCDPGYFTELEKSIRMHPLADGFNLYFEHPLDGREFPEQVYEAAAQYELHLRYTIESLRYAGFPYAFHTVGSSYAVKAETYARQGGMNRKQSGEDFYFLHKIIPLGNFYEINTTCVFPSPRPSDRVPFGTGPAIRKLIQQPEGDLLTYNPRLFDMLKVFLSLVPAFFKQPWKVIGNRLDALDPVLREYLEKRNVQEKMEEINGNCSSLDSYLKRFYRWFDAFTVLKFLNAASMERWPKVPVELAAFNLLGKLRSGVHQPEVARVLLKRYRELGRRGYTISLPPR